MPKCKCRKCGAVLDKKNAFAVKTGKRNSYYCNEEEYRDSKKTSEISKESKELIDSINKKVFEIFGYYINNRAYYSNMSNLYKKHKHQDVLDCIIENEQLFNQVMQKDFDTEYGKIRYFVVVLENKLLEHKPKETFVRNVENDMPEIHYTKKKRKKSLEDFEMEVG